MEYSSLAVRDCEDDIGVGPREPRCSDDGAPASVFLIGGADGHDPALRDKADHLISFGKATWPHLLVRAMLAEQLYRAMTILSGHPYHRS